MRNMLLRILIQEDPPLVARIKKAMGGVYTRLGEKQAAASCNLRANNARRCPVAWPVEPPVEAGRLRKVGFVALATATQPNRQQHPHTQELQHHTSYTVGLFVNSSTSRSGVECFGRTPAGKRTEPSEIACSIQKTRDSTQPTRGSTVCWDPELHQGIDV